VQAIIANMPKEQKDAVKATLDKMSAGIPADMKDDELINEAFKYAHHVITNAGK
jgi:hypothetical protein